MVIATALGPRVKKPEKARARSETSRKRHWHLSRGESELLTLLAEKPLLSGAQISAVRMPSTLGKTSLLAQLERRGLLASSVAPGQVDVPRSRHYYLTDEGIRALAQREGVVPGHLAKKHWLSASRITTLFNALEHTRACRQFFVDLAIQAQQHTGDALDVWQDEAAASRRYLWHGDVRLLRPDGYGVYRRNAQALAFFLEWDSGNSGIKRHRRKLRTYHECRATLGDRMFPAILMVTVRDRVRQLNRAAWDEGRRRRDVLLPLLIAVNTEIETCGAFGCRWWDVRAQKTVTLESVPDLWIEIS